MVLHFIPNLKILYESAVSCKLYWINFEATKLGQSLLSQYNKKKKACMQTNDSQWERLRKGYSEHLSQQGRTEMIPKERKKKKVKKKSHWDELLWMPEHDFQLYRYRRPKHAKIQKCGPIGPSQLTSK